MRRKYCAISLASLVGICQLLSNASADTPSIPAPPANGGVQSAPQATDSLIKSVTEKLAEMADKCRADLSTAADAAQAKSISDACSSVMTSYSNALKSVVDSGISLGKEDRALSREKNVTDRSRKHAEPILYGLYAIDVLVVIAGIMLAALFWNSAGAREVFKDKDNPADSGKYSFSRVLGAIGSTIFMVFTIYFLNVTVSHYLVSGVLLDGASTLIAATAGLLTSLLPYIANKIGA